ncbi:putative ribonuclease H-like domain-containing protein [Tanacetum coccineum]|uniref:Ribonuclease H-like domain-containing protein n=1 Tax=Tanacetum coccineum TaxID=301880 RepID=A0ABQ5G8T9_9ASTR
MVRRTVLTRSGLISLNTARPVNTVQPRTAVNNAGPLKNVINNAYSTARRPFNKITAANNSNFTIKVNTVKETKVNNAKPKAVVNTARPKAVLSAVKGNKRNVVKASACWVWKPKTKVIDHGNPQQDLKDKGVIESGCSRHMTGNRSYLTDYEEIDGGFVAFGGNSKGGKITGKGKIRTGKLDFKDVYFVKELKFNLFSVSQMCDKKNSVLFTDTECVVLSPDFKLTDESHVLLKVPRENNMYSVDLKNVVPQGGLTYLFVKATPDESNLWHRRLGHVNFKTVNKLVKGNLVRGLPSKLFEINQTCVACQKGKKHKAYCKTKTVTSISQPLQMLHMDLFGPTFVNSLIKKMYCLVVTDYFSRFSWVFFLATKDETSEILKTFIIGIENLIDLRVKVIRCDNGTKFKNRVMNQFCEMKGIEREFSVARTPQQNGVAERKNRTLIEAARTMLADSKLPTTFWAEAVNTACYVQNRVLIIKPHNKTPYELFLGRKPALSFMKPFGCPVTILNTIDHLGKFDGKANEGFFVGYSTNSKAFRVFNSRTRIVEENLHVKFNENTPNIAGSGPKWIFHIDTLTKSINYKQVVAGNQSNGSAGTKVCDSTGKARVETVPGKEYILLPLWTQDSQFSSSSKDSPDARFKPSGEKEKKDVEDPGNEDSEVPSTEEPRVNQEKDANVNSTNNINTVSSTDNAVDIEDNDVEENIVYRCADDLNMPNLEKILYSDDGEDVDEEADMNNLDAFIPVSHIPTTRGHKDHPVEQIIRDLNSAPQTRRMTKKLEEHGLFSSVQQRTNHKDFQNCLFSCFLSQVEPKKAIQALTDPSWIEAMQDELLQFKLQKFWATAKAKTVNGERQIQALVDKKKVIITETSVRSDLQLDNAKGTECLPNDVIFEQLTLMGFVQAFLNEQLDDMSKHKEIYVTPSHTKKIFANMKREGKGFSGRVTPLLQTMMVQAPEEVEPIPDEVAIEEHEPTHSNDLLLSGEDRLKLTELMELCTNLQKKVLDLEEAKTAQAKEIASLKKRVKKLEKRRKSRTSRLKRLRKVGRTARIESSDEAGLGDQEDASKQGRKIVDINRDAEVTLIDETQGRSNDNLMFDTGIFDEQKVKVEKIVSTAEVEVTTASATTTTADELTLAQTLIEIKAAKPKAKDKGKAKMVEPEKPLKKKDQIMYDQEVALNLQAQLEAELEEEERLARQKEEEANIALIESWDNTQAMMETDFQMAQQLHAEEQEQLSIEEKSKLFVELMNKRKKHFAEIRAKEKRNKPPTQSQ